MRLHATFGEPGRARRVLDVQQRFATGIHGGLKGRIAATGFFGEGTVTAGCITDHEYILIGQRWGTLLHALENRQESGFDDEERDIRIVVHVVELGSSVGSVRRYHDGTEAGEGKPGHGKLDAVRYHDGNVAACSNT